MKKINIENLGHGCTARGALSLVLAGSLALPLSFAPNLAFAEEASEKDETVYVRANAEGEVESINVVNMFETDSAEDVSDPANYTSVKNLSSNEVLSQQDGAVDLTTLAGEPFYYQGTMDAGTELPWDVSVSYRLDGEEISAEDLAGKTGELELTLSVSARTDDDAVSDFANAFVLQAQGTFPADNLKITEADDVTQAKVGDNTIANCMVLPGESKTFTIKGDAKNFEYDGWQVSAMPLSLAIDLASEDTSALTEKTDEIVDAATTINDGANSLSEGLSTLTEGSGSLSSATSQLVDGVGQITDGVSAAISAIAQISANSAALNTGAADLVNGAQQYVDTLSASASQYEAGAASVDSAKAAYAQAFAALQADPTNQDAYVALNSSVEALAQASAASGAYAALTQAISGFSPILQGAQTLAASIQQYTSGVDQVAASSTDLGAGADQLSSATGQIASGAQSLNEGAASAQNGAESLAEGTGEFKSQLDGIDDKILDELQDTIDEKLGADFEEHSFVVASNTNVDSVQFVYVIDGVSVEDDDENTTTADDEDEDATILDRFFDLFN